MELKRVQIRQFEKFSRAFIKIKKNKIKCNLKIKTKANEFT